VRRVLRDRLSAPGLDVPGLLGLLPADHRPPRPSDRPARQGRHQGGVSVTEQEREGQQIGADQWVARAEELVERRRGIAGALESSWKRLPPPAQLLAVAGAAAIFGSATSNGYYLRV